MNINVAVDTYAFVKRLSSVGFTEEQAEVLVEKQSHLILERLATKQDMSLFNRSS
jgi:hypothetical protein